MSEFASARGAVIVVSSEIDEVLGMAARRAGDARPADRRRDARRRDDHARPIPSRGLERSVHVHEDHRRHGPALTPEFRWIGTGDIAGVPIPVVIFAVVFLIAWWTLTQTRFGRRIYAAVGELSSSPTAKSFAHRQELRGRDQGGGRRGRRRRAL